MATIQQFAAHPAVSDEALNLTSRTGPAPLMGGAGPGPAIALMGRAALARACLAHPGPAVDTEGQEMSPNAAHLHLGQKPARRSGHEAGG